MTTLTVCVPNFNHGRYIEAALRSVLAQSLAPTQVVVIDDASKDDSVEIVTRMAAEFNTLELIRNETNRGVFESVRRGLERATGEFFYLLAADDQVLPGFFERAVTMLQRFPDAGMCSVAIKYLDADGNLLPAEQRPSFHTHAEHDRVSEALFLPPDNVRKRLKRQPWFVGGIAGVLFRRTAFQESGGLRGELGLLADWFAPHYAALRYGMCYIPEELAAFRILPTSFGTSIALRPRVVLENAVGTVRLMRSPQFSSVFPEEFVAQAERDLTYGAFRGALVNWQTSFVTDLSRLVPPIGLLSRLVLKCVRLAMKAQWFLLRTYCAGRVAKPLREEVVP